MLAMFKVDDVGRWHIGSAETAQEAEARISAFAKFWPAEYAVLDQETGAWTSFQAYQQGTRIDFRKDSKGKLHRPR